MKENENDIYIRSFCLICIILFEFLHLNVRLSRNSFAIFSMSALFKILPYNSFFKQAASVESIKSYNLTQVST